MDYLAPQHWPPEARAGFCYKLPNDDDTDCRMKEGLLTVRYCIPYNIFIYIYIHRQFGFLFIE